MESWILALPFLLLLLLVVAIFLICFKKWRWVLGILAVAFVLNWYGEVFALHPFGCLFASGSGEDIKVMTFNVHGSGEDFNERIDGIVDLLNHENPDILFLCEIFTPYKHYDEQLDSILKNKYPYFSYKQKTQWGNAFYSKFPIEVVEMVGITISKSQPLVLINANGKNLTMFGCHLSSNNYVDTKTRMEVDSIRSKSDVKQYLKTLEKGYKLRRQDVDSIGLRLLDTDIAHTIVLGDMNDVGGSYSIRHLEFLGFQDAWWKGGFGFGGTRKVLGFPFRIDHILYGDGFELKEVKVVGSKGLSDHNALIARFEIKE